MKSIVYTVFMIVLWIVNLFNDSGLGQMYQTTEKARSVIFAVFIVIVILSFRNGHLGGDTYDYFVFGGMFLSIFADSYIKGYGNMGIHYISVFLLIYILGRCRFSILAIKLTGIAYFALGMSILYIYDYTSVLSGWNGNTIGMIGLYSFLVFLISLYDVAGIKSKIIILIFTGIYINLLEPTGSRSSILFAIVAVLFALSILPRRIIMVTDKRYYWWLLFPLFIAVFVINISHGSYMNKLDLWSIQNFQKPLFNGRDKLWESGFKILREHILFGSGTLEGNWHNSVVTILTAYGCVGFVFWTLSLQRILAKGRKWIDDLIVSGSIITFIIMYIQQSVELGMISENPNLLPYIVLGIMLGRIKLLDEEIEDVERA